MDHRVGQGMSTNRTCMVASPNVYKSCWLADDQRDRCSFVAASITLFLFACTAFSGVLVYVNHQLNQELRLVNARTDLTILEMSALARRVNETEKVLRDHTRQLATNARKLEQKLLETSGGSDAKSAKSLGLGLLKESESNKYDRSGIIAVEYEGDIAGEDEDEEEGDYAPSSETDNNDNKAVAATAFDNHRPSPPNKFTPKISTSNSTAETVLVGRPASSHGHLTSGSSETENSNDTRTTSPPHKFTPAVSLSNPVTDTVFTGRQVSLDCNFTSRPCTSATQTTSTPRPAGDFSREAGPEPHLNLTINVRNGTALKTALNLPHRENASTQPAIEDEMVDDESDNSSQGDDFIGQPQTMKPRSGNQPRIQKRSAEILSSSSNTLPQPVDTRTEECDVKNQTTMHARLNNNSISEKCKPLTLPNQHTILPSQTEDKVTQVTRRRRVKSKNLQPHSKGKPNDQFKYAAQDVEFLESITVKNDAEPVEVDVTVAAHFVANISSPKINNANYTGNGRYLHPKGEYTEWVPVDGWFENFQMDNHVSLKDGGIKIRTAGLYFVYAQIFYSDSKMRIGYTINQNSKAALQCMMQSNGTSKPSDGLKSTTCFTGGILRCNAGDSLTIEAIAPNIHVMLEPSKSFFGLFRLAPTP